MTEKKSMSIKKEWIDGIKEESFGMGRENWALAFNFGGLQNNEDFYIINEYLFKKLQTYIKED